MFIKCLVCQKPIEAMYIAYCSDCNLYSHHDYYLTKERDYFSDKLAYFFTEELFKDIVKNNNFVVYAYTSHNNQSIFLFSEVFDKRPCLKEVIHLFDKIKKFKILI